MASDFSVQFGEILETPTIYPDEQGKVNVTITNQGDTQTDEPITFNLYASTDKALDKSPLNTLGDPRGSSDRLEGTDELLGTQTLNLAAGESETITIDFASPEFRTASVVSPGAYYLIGEVVPDNASGDNDTSTNTPQLITQGDVVIQWNSIALNAIQTGGKNGNPTPPPVGARNQAIVHAAIYDAVNAIDGSYKPYLVNMDAPAGMSIEAAAVGAAYKTLSELYEDQRPILTEQRDRSLNEITDDPAAEKAGFDFGVQVAEQILAERANDGSATAQGPYTPGTGIGDWQPTFTDGETTNNSTNMAPALLPQWGLVTPFGIDSASQFRPNTFPQYNSPRYAREFNEVKVLGEENSAVRNADETEIAQFWAYDRADTFGPPGQWNELAQEVALAEDNTLVENARLFAQLNIAMADAGIVAWDAKYTYEQLRPITAIREADQDNNPNTTVDPDWEPLLDTPPFPDYVSGHSIFGGAAAEVLANFFGDDTSFDIPSQDLPGVARSYGSFTQAAQENADSRLFGGVHIDTANVDGVAIGQDVGNFVFNNVLT